MARLVCMLVVTLSFATLPLAAADKTADTTPEKGKKPAAQTSKAPQPDWDGAASQTPEGETGWNADGYRSGLAAHYYRDPDQWDGQWAHDSSTPTGEPKDWTFSTYKYTRVEPLINHQFIKRGWFSVRWQGTLDTHPGHPKGQDDPDASVAYTFSLWADDGCRLRIDGTTAIDDWRACAEDDPQAVRKAEVKLKPGKHTIVVEYFQGQSLRKKDRDPIKLYWACPERKLPQQIVPASHFSHTRDDLAPAAGRLDPKKGEPADKKPAPASAAEANDPPSKRAQDMPQAE